MGVQGGGEPAARRAVSDVGIALAIPVLGGVCTAAGMLLVDRAPTAAPAFDVVVGVAAGVAGLLITAWWVVSLLVTTVLTVRAVRVGGAADPAPGLLRPAFMRRLVAVLLSGHLVAGALTTGMTSSALAASPTASASPLVSTSPLASTSPLVRVPAIAAVPAPDPSFVPSAPAISDGTLLVRRPQRGDGVTPGATVAVLAGDSLWALAARQLGPLGTDLEIARQWPAWYELNRAVIGPDPNRLTPGQILRVPAPLRPEDT